MAESLNRSGGELVIASPGVLRLLGAALIASLALLCMLGPPLSLEAAWDGRPGEATLTVAPIAVATMLTIAVGRAVADWLTEIESRKAWAAIGVPTGGLPTTPAVQVPDQSHDFIRPAANNEALARPSSLQLPALGRSRGQG